MKAPLFVPHRLLAITVLVAGCRGEGGQVSASTDDLPGTSEGAGSSDGDVTGSSADSDPAESSEDGPGTTSGPGESESESDGSAGDDTTTGAPCEPHAEICDGLDDDCDRIPDNGNPGGGEPCDTKMPGECAAGETACEGGAIVCNAAVTAGTELCDGFDNDCDGEVDEDDPGSGAACITGMAGVCSAGVEHCQRGAIACVPDAQPSDEQCDGLDNDCDDEVDEENPGGGAPCDTGLSGECAAGTETCVEGSVQCVQDVPASAEICANGLDDDCNGSVDDGCPCAHDICSSGEVLDPDCDPCVAAICDVDGFCCTNGWDGICVGEVATVCGSAVCLSPSCAHPLCSSGVALANGCHTCVTQICAADPFCCSGAWDSICVGEVGSICGLTC